MKDAFQALVALRAARHRRGRAQGGEIAGGQYRSPREDHVLRARMRCVPRRTGVDSLDASVATSVQGSRPATKSPSAFRQDRALPFRHSAHGTVQSPFCFSVNGGPPVLCTSTTSPGTEKLKNHLAFSPLRFRQPWLVSVLPCAHTVALSWCM